MPTKGTDIEFSINGERAAAPAGSSVAAALLSRGITHFRTSVSGEARAPLCGMGICFECRVTIDGQPHQKACQLMVLPGMQVVTDG
jgi:sarcosine oxidase subunit alpha